MKKVKKLVCNLHDKFEVVMHTGNLTSIKSGSSFKKLV